MNIRECLQELNVSMWMSKLMLYPKNHILLPPQVDFMLTYPFGSKAMRLQEHCHMSIKNESPVPYSKTKRYLTYRLKGAHYALVDIIM